MEIKEQLFDTGVVTLNYAEGPATGSSDVEVARGLQLLAQSRHVHFEGISHMLFNEPHGKEPVLQAISEFLVSVEPG